MQSFLEQFLRGNSENAAPAENVWRIKKIVQVGYYDRCLLN